MLLKEFVEQSRSSLSEIYSKEEAALLTEMLCTEIFGLQGYAFLIDPERKLGSAVLDKALQCLRRLMGNEPIQYVLGYTEFYGEKFNVAPGVLIPRPETELLCRHAIEEGMRMYRSRSAYGSSRPPVKILDLCSGSGCIAWTLASCIPMSGAVGLDISADAVQIAVNQPISRKKGVCASFVVADIFDDDAVEKALAPSAPFDLVVSNPPYILEKEKAAMRRNVLDWEPDIALFVPDDDFGVFYRKIAGIADKYMNTDAVGFVEINEAFGDATARIFASAGFSAYEVLKDISGKNRFVKFRK